MVLLLQYSLFGLYLDSVLFNLKLHSAFSDATQRNVWYVSTKLLSVICEKILICLYSSPWERSIYYVFHVARVVLLKHVVNESKIGNLSRWLFTCIFIVYNCDLYTEHSYIQTDQETLQVSEDVFLTFLRVSCTLNLLTLGLKKETIPFFRPSVNMYQTTWRHFPETAILHSHRLRN
jgi:hypothetical protein